MIEEIYLVKDINLSTRARMESQTKLHNFKTSDLYKTAEQLNPDKFYHKCDTIKYRKLSQNWLHRLYWKGGGDQISQSQATDLKIDQSEQSGSRTCESDSRLSELDHLCFHDVSSNERNSQKRNTCPSRYGGTRWRSETMYKMFSIVNCTVNRTVYRSMLHSVLYVLFMLSLLFSSINCQVCNLATDCYPPSEDLLNANDLRVITTSTTCGENGDTEYRKSSATLDTTPYVCNAAEPHPVEYLTDGDERNILNFTYDAPFIQTYWQSENTISVVGGIVEEETVIANFSDPFLIRYIRIIFKSPWITSATSNSDMRPRAMVIERMSNRLSDWEALRYFAEDCAEYFPGIPQQSLDGTGPVFPSNIPVCLQKYYANDDTTFTGWGLGNQEVKFSPTLEPEFGTSPNLQRHYTAYALRLRLVEPADSTPLASYYAIADIEIDGHCLCFGHSSSCTGPNFAQCNCAHNTLGPNCEECQPLFNNKPWRMGANNLANACEDCGCNEHADSCHYDEVKGYGVCDGCRDHTAGDKCNFCTSYYFVNPDKDLYNDTNPAPTDCTGFNGTAIETYDCGSWCIPCDCSRNGSLAFSMFNCNNFTGRCECKRYAAGRACDECLDGFWNLDRLNPDGCTQCQCNSLGTNNTNNCDKDTGNCQCKANTEGQTCDTCKPGYYALSFTNPDGCTACNCDPGGSIDVICPVDTGECECRENIGGRTCSDPFIGFYVPRLDDRLFEAEFADNSENYVTVERPGHGEPDGTVTGVGFLQMPAPSTLTFTITVPQTINYNAVIRYESAATFLGATVTITHPFPASAGFTDYVCGGATYTNNEVFTVTQDLPITNGLTDAVIMGSVCLRGNTEYTATVAFTNSIPAGSNILLDSLLLLPVLDDLNVYANATPEVQQAMDACYTATLSVNLALRSNLSCDVWDYAIMSELFGGASGCQCDSVGSTGGACSAVGGQCPCKPGVMLQDCSMCMVDYYGFDTSDGCTACNCDVLGSVVTSCNDTGICECKENVMGTKCDSCIPNYFGLFTGQGCQLCVCNADYAVNVSCMDSGQCHCKPGIGEIECTACLDGYYNLTLDGCTDCDCDVDGRGGEMCDKGTGVCTCKPQVEGDKCDTCVDGYFGLGQWNPVGGCLQCFCSGHSGVCTTATDWFYARIENDWSLLDDSAVQNQWTGVDDLGEPIEVTYPTKITNNQAEHVMRITNDGVNLNHENLYFVATAEYLGDKRGAYGQELSVVLTTVTPLQPENTTVDLTDGSGGDVILEGLWTNFKLVAPFLEMPNETLSAYTFQLKEDSWRIDTVTGLNPTYFQMMQVLSGLKAIKVRAKYTNATGTLTDLHSATLTYAVALESQSSGQPITNIENCTCTVGYTGQFCEQCASGYRRSEPDLGPFSECILCDCNNHDGGPCHPETGVCNCTHSTTGDNCQLCLPGYYGDPTLGSPGDCQQCMCPGSIPDSAVNVFASLCEADATADGGYRCINCTEGHGGDHCEFCVDQWYGTPEDTANFGGRCVGCICNTRADTCNTTTGFCIDCRNNTAGQECDICAPGFRGIADTYSCEACECDSPGATGGCNHRTGQCECKPNVIGFYCTHCDTNTFNYSSGEGCEPCDCHQTGSFEQSCDLITGQCDCRNLVVGRQCDACEDTYWRISQFGCESCECTAEGTINTTTETFGKCDLDSGQCQCARPGIIGRTCDQCARGTMETYIYSDGLEIGIYPECELCGECYDSWAVKIDQVGIDMTTEYEIAMAIWNQYDGKSYDNLSPVIGFIGGNLSAVASSIDMAMSMITDLNYLRTGFEEIEENTNNLTDVITDTMIEVSSIQNALTENRQYQGLIQVNATHIVTPLLMQNYTQGAYNYITALYTAANLTWEIIENQTSLIQQSNGNIDIFLTTVNTAMGVLAQAQSTRMAAEMIVGGTFPAQYTLNTGKLATLQTTINRYPSEISAINTQVQSAVSLVTQANQTVTYAAALVGQRQQEMSGMVTQAERIKFNATQAQTAAITARGAVNTFKNLATLTKQEMTQSLEDVAIGLQTLVNISNEISRGQEMESNASSIVLRSLQEMLDITNQIQRTQVSADDVSRTLQAAEDGLQVAENAQNITEIAVVESNKALAQIELIQYNLEQAEVLQNSTKQILDQISDHNRTINLIIDEVNRKAADGIELESQTTYNINGLLAYINRVSRCFDDQEATMNAITLRLTQADNTTEASATQAVANQQQVLSLDTPITNKKLELEVQFAEVNQVRSEVTQLQADLVDVTSIFDLQRMLNEFTAQSLEMGALQTQLDNLEGELDALLAALDLLDPATTSCS